MKTIYEEIKCPHCDAYFHQAVIATYNENNVLINTSAETNCPRCKKSVYYLNEKIVIVTRK